MPPVRFRAAFLRTCPVAVGCGLRDIVNGPERREADGLSTLAAVARATNLNLQPKLWRPADRFAANAEPGFCTDSRAAARWQSNLPTGRPTRAQNPPDG